MRLVSALWLCTVGCGFHGTGGHPMDGTPDAPEGCLGTGNWIVCPPEPPTTQLVLGSTLDTGTDSHCISDPIGWGMHQDDACIIVATDIAAGNVTVTGPRPLVLVATGGIIVSSLLDVSSQFAAGRKGPYTPSAACTQTAGGTMTAGGGGGGGSFGTAGGYGGLVANNTATRGSPGPIAEPPVERLRGGCPGGNGGNGALATAGNAGDGGGAVYLLAGGAINLTGRINASGAGGSGATGKKSGGGGGGSGGMIVLFAGSIVTQTGAQLFANGGGGGGGSDDGTNAMPGKDSTSPMTGAVGGNGGGGGGRPGAAGGFLAMPPGQGGDNNMTDGGGGGGGGSVGVIRVISGGGLGPALVSPSPT